MGFKFRKKTGLLPRPRRLCFRSGLCVCLSVCLSVCKKISESYEWIWWNFLEGEAWAKDSGFLNPARNPNLGIFKQIFDDIFVRMWRVSRNSRLDPRFLTPDGDPDKVFFKRFFIYYYDSYRQPRIKHEHPGGGLSSAEFSLVCILCCTVDLEITCIVFVDTFSFIYTNVDNVWVKIVLS